MSYAFVRLTKEDLDYLLTELAGNILLEQTQLIPTMSNIDNSELVFSGQDFGILSTKEALKLVFSGQDFGIELF